jgi:hypothetical protein
MAADSMESVAFVAVPFPAQGHLNLSLLVAYVNDTEREPARA